jgi:hypothetical protein
MNPKKIELDVDFIGGQEPLTPVEEKALGDYFKQRKSKAEKSMGDKDQKSIKRPKAKA